MKKSFTLMEMLVAMTCGLLLLGALYGVYNVSYKSYRRSVNQSELSQNARIALERITRDLRQTNRVTTELPPDTTDPQNPPTNNIQFEDGHDTNQIRYIKYYLDQNNLHRQVIHYFFSSDPNTWVVWNAQDQFGNLAQESIDEDTIKADKINSLSFYGNNLINIDLTVSDADYNFSYKTAVLGRNVQ